MEAKDRNNIQRQILEKYPGTIPDMDIDWEMGEIFYKAGIRATVGYFSKHWMGAARGMLLYEISDKDRMLLEDGILPPDVI